MEKFKEAAITNLQTPTEKGPLTVAQLNQLSIDELDRLALKLDEEYAKSGKKSYIKRKTPKDRVLKLQRDIVVELLEDKVEAAEIASNAAEIKAEEQKLLARLKEIENDDFEKMSKEDVVKKLKELEKKKAKS